MSTEAHKVLLHITIRVDGMVSDELLCQGLRRLVLARHVPSFTCLVPAVESRTYRVPLAPVRVPKWRAGVSATRLPSVLSLLLWVSTPDSSYPEIPKSGPELVTRKRRSFFFSYHFFFPSQGTPPKETRVGKAM